MPTIYRKESTRLTVADAKRLIIEGLPEDEAMQEQLRGFAVFRGVARPDGEIDWDIEKPTIETFRETSKRRLDNAFIALCEEAGFAPHLAIDPTVKAYRPCEQDDNLYMVTHAQFELLANTYGLSVAIIEPAASDEKTRRTPDQGIRWTPEFIEEVRAYRANHTEAKTADKYGVSGALIRRKVAPPKKAIAHPFSGLGSRTK